jgi:hypothetical protein
MRLQLGPSAQIVLRLGTVVPELKGDARVGVLIRSVYQD